MAVTEPERLALHAAARGALGPEEGDTLMASLPPANTEIATRQDVERLETATRQDLERMRGDLERVEAGLSRELERVETGLHRELERVETGLHRELENQTAAIRKDLDQQAVTFGTNLQASEHRQQAHVWKVVVGTGVVLFVATVAAFAAIADLMR